MLGKLIKNEFVQRGKQVALIFCAILGMSLVTALLWIIEPYVISNFFGFFLGLVTTMYGIGIVAAAVGLLMLAIGDFGKRLFKDQGYLTHTLPVKTSSIIFARMVFDVVLIIAMAVIFPIAISIAWRDFTAIGEMFKGIGELITSLSGGALETSIVVMDLILALGAVLLSSLQSLWMFNAAYAIGHSFNTAKKAMSVAAYMIMTVVSGMVMYFFGWFMSETGLDEVVVKGLDSSLHPEVSLMVLLIFTCVITAVGVAIFAVITSFVCKKRLNLE
ncbi:MAG: hypothetical protein K2G45_04215 [Lachnospiraceae bacterium]|nr:hypothetical protein [Lachnospiraceae bacterium]